MKTKLVKKSELNKKESNDSVTFEKLILPDGYNIESGFKQKEKLWDPNPKYIQESFMKIVSMWNKDQKSRNFVKHLIAGFLPVDYWCRMSYCKPEDEEKVVCAISGFKLTGLKNVADGIAPISTKRLFLVAHMQVENRTELTDTESEEFDLLLSQLSLPIKNGQVAFMSDSSDKFLSQESVLALLEFVQFGLLRDNKEFTFLVIKMRTNQMNDYLPKEKQFTKSQVNHFVKATTYGMKDCIKGETLTKLEALKAELESK